MLDKSVKQVQHQFELAFTHSFDHELFVMCKKEETTTLSGAFASIEDLFVVPMWTEAMLKHLQGQVVLLE